MAAGPVGVSIFLPDEHFLEGSGGSVCLELSPEFGWLDEPGFLKVKFGFAELVFHDGGVGLCDVFQDLGEVGSQECSGSGFDYVDGAVRGCYEVCGVSLAKVLGFTDGYVGFDELVDISAQDERVVGCGVDFHGFAFLLCVWCWFCEECCVPLGWLEVGVDRLLNNPTARRFIVVKTRSEGGFWPRMACESFVAPYCHHSSRLYPLSRFFRAIGYPFSALSVFL